MKKLKVREAHSELEPRLSVSNSSNHPWLTTQQQQQNNNHYNHNTTNKTPIILSTYHVLSC